MRSPQQTSYAQIIGQVVRGTRELMGVDLPTMAAAMGLSASGWSRVETGDTTMTVPLLRKAAGRLGLEPWALLQRADHLAAHLVQQGVHVSDERSRGVEQVVIGGAALLALFAGGAALAAKANTPIRPRRPTTKRKP